MRVLVAGLGMTGQALVPALVRDGDDVVTYDDRDGAVALAAELGVGLIDDDDGAVRDAVAHCELVVVSPGLPPDHRVVRAARDAGVAVIGDIELAARRTTTPIVAVTGTNGKSTITRLITLMLQASGVDAVEAGNMGRPFVDAITEPADVYVVEVSSQQLFSTDRFHPRVAVWSNLSPDHLDWHPDLGHYIQAKSRIWANQTGSDVAVVNAEDPVVMSAAAGAPGRVVTFGLVTGDARVDASRLLAPDGTDLGGVADLARPFPHEQANALAAATAALAVGATPEGVRATLSSFPGLPHRIELVGHIGAVPFYDDSKATTPASVVTALAGFDHAVLIAGGKNKGLDLAAMAKGADHVRAVVTIGAAAREVEAAFSGIRPVVRAASMDDAVAAAAELAKPGDVVLLSPGCTSWDAYPNYAARGDDFARAVREQAKS